LLAAHQRSDNIVSFKVDKASGRLTPAGHQVAVAKPVCLQVVPEFK
jgi:6-phosphogluconolactonase